MNPKPKAAKQLRRMSHSSKRIASYINIGEWQIRESEDGSLVLVHTMTGAVTVLARK